jgi:hypothetical protein
MGVRTTQKSSAGVRRCACGGLVGPTGECASCKQKRLQREARNVGPAQAPPAVHDVLSSQGRPLEPRVRDAMENRFQHDFSRVRVHSDGQAAESARAVGARAYTVGEHIAFGAGRYAPQTRAGAHLIAHELAHVKQQAGNSSQAVMPRLTVGENGSPLEREADIAADAVVAGGKPVVARRSDGAQLQRHPDDLVAYTGGQSGHLLVFKEGAPIFRGPAVSGHPGGSEWEVNVGPTPTGVYHIHPGITRTPVTSLEDGVCGAAGIGSGYQEITSTDTSECEAGSHHYCNVSCPTAANPAQLCWTPRDCWGPKRIRIEGSADVLKPKGGKAHRDGFYLHGGNPLDPISSGCVKALDNDVFPAVRTLTGTAGRVRFCVGNACPASVMTAAAAAAAVEAAAQSVASAFVRSLR